MAKDDQGKPERRADADKASSGTQGIAMHHGPIKVAAPGGVK